MHGRGKVAHGLDDMICTREQFLFFFPVLGTLFPFLIFITSDG